MALFKGTIYKRQTAGDVEQWVNVYHVEALGPASALDTMQSIAELEALIYFEDTLIYRLSVKPVAGTATAVRSVALPGARTGSWANLVPMFNTVRVILGDEFERSESKYLRATIMEDNLQGIRISGELRDAIDNDYSQPLLGILGLRGPNGEQIVTATTQQLVQMRQLGWHRRTRPGFKRGWVPV